MIEIDNLRLTRGGAPVLYGIDLRIPAQGIIAIIGPNGAGKSTLLHTVAGLIAPDAGHVTIEGRNIHAMTEAERALHLSVLTQSQGAVPRLSVAELIAFGRWPHHRGRPGPQDRAAIAEAIDRFELKPLLDREVESLSGGQKQRAYVAMAYAQTTPWMLLDEPLAALDPKYTRDIMDRLRGLTDRTVLLVLHDLAVAAMYADWVVGLKHGRVHCAGPWREVVTSEVLSDLYGVPLEVTETSVIWA
ncbi:ATP-binding cassette domain-containing protein [Tropicibacter naphthalenivorans]|uniref:Putative siderophore transport system ATP-binding protein YusV n=1 Tax=Tropicibacter naphthalenivorans TaxID=441103 RepID=A0A0P1GL79_9RHOB|nr:ATP-binding cassette domain-containing protein [Tropicibacter naphthalenivorans]CUH82528.1 putative siderophore transport system ATP-binding protein YusV [Tropicibacter naphthalenivorans]SMD10600.1 iron complex transport system ATP-binding protein [Tropicibacter naphthalenivorans]